MKKRNRLTIIGTNIIGRSREDVARCSWSIGRDSQGRYFHKKGEHLRQVPFAKTVLLFRQGQFNAAPGGWEWGPGSYRWLADVAKAIEDKARRASKKRSAWKKSHTPPLAVLSGKHREFGLKLADPKNYPKKGWCAQ